MKDRTAAQRWNSKDRRPGSACHELVVLPTLLPSAAQPYTLPGVRPGTTIFDNLPFSQSGLQDTNTQTGENVAAPGPSQV